MGEEGGMAAGEEEAEAAEARVETAAAAVRAAAVDSCRKRKRTSTVLDVAAQVEIVRTI